MVPSQDPTPPTTSRTRQQDWNRNIRSMLWIVRVGLALAIPGLVLMLISQSSPFSTWFTGGLLLVALSFVVFGAVPNSLVALGHPWGDGWRHGVDERYLHPRLGGLAFMWAFLAVPGWMIAVTLFEFPFSLDQTVVYTLAVGVVALAPMLVILLFDRRR